MKLEIFNKNGYIQPVQWLNFPYTFNGWRRVVAVLILLMTILYYRDRCEFIRILEYLIKIMYACRSYMPIILIHYRKIAFSKQRTYTIHTFIIYIIFIPRIRLLVSLQVLLLLTNSNLPLKPRYSRNESEWKRIYAFPDFIRICFGAFVPQNWPKNISEFSVTIGRKFFAFVGVKI